MMLTDREKKQIAARARTLRDWLDTPRSRRTTEQIENDTDWLTAWCDRVADGDETAFRRRLELSDRSLDECRRRLQDLSWPESEPLPAWVGRVDDILEYVATHYAEDPPDPIADDVPFSAIFTAIAKYASAQVDWTAVSEDAIHGFERWLVDRLSNRFAHPLFIEFKLFLAERDEELALADDPEMPNQPRQHYDAFVRNFLSRGMKPFFVQYGVLAKLVAINTAQWVEAVEEFCARFEADRPALVETFGAGEALGRIVDVETFGDAHHGGRNVFGLTFESGVTIAYKPRNLEIDAAYHDLLSWVNERSDLPDFRTLTYLVREEYGWQEWVEAESCESTAGVARYYRRAGALVALLYALNFTDGHLENIVAAGDQPTVVDLETLLVPDMDSGKRVGTSSIDEEVQETVLRTLVLPMHLPSADLQNTGGLGASEGKETGIEIPEFENVNTDVMELTYRETAIIEGENLPRLDGEQVRPTTHSDEFEDGFERGYRFLLSRRDGLLAPDGPLAAFTDVETRFLYRSTQTYRRTLVPFTTPSYLRSGVQCDCRIESLARPFAEGNVDERMWGVFEAERDALLQFDIPRFTVNTSSRDLSHGDRTIPDVFEATPMEQVRRRIESLSEADLREQLSYVVLAYDSNRLAYPTRPGSSTVDTERSVPNPELAVETATDIFGRIQERSFRSLDDEVTWRLRDNRDTGINFHLINNDLYEGRMGVALFSAALARCSGDDRHRSLAADVASAISDELDGDSLDDRVGAGHGMGSILYGFAKLAELLDADEYLDPAREIATRLTAERFEGDDAYDALNGSAGAILSLLALHENTGDSDLLDRAVTAGEYLLENRIEVDGVRTWNTVDLGNRPLLGMSHGAAGIGYALYRLGEATGGSRFREAAVEGFEYERQRYDPDENDWPDLRTESEVEFSPGWCSGRDGIGLSRLELFDLTDDASFRREADDALRGIDPTVLLDRDHLCCGNASRIEFLLRAARILDDPTYREQAWTIALEMVQQADQNGQFVVPWQTEHWYNPTFFTGEAGIGYSLLRLVDPELPCVLLWE